MAQLSVLFGLFLWLNSHYLHWFKQNMTTAPQSHSILCFLPLPEHYYQVPSKPLLLRFADTLFLVTNCQHDTSPRWVLSYSIFPQSLSLKCSYYHLLFFQEPKSYFSQMREESRIHNSIAIIALAFLLRKTNKSSICILVFVLFLSPLIIL